MNYEELTAQLRAGSTAQGQIAAMKQKAAMAKELRGSNYANIKGADYGHQSVTGGIRDAFNQYRGNAMQVDADEGLGRATGQLATAENAGTLYNAKVAQEAEKTRQREAKAKAGALVEANRLKNEQDVAAAALLADDKRFNVGKDASFIDKDGNLIFSGTGGKAGTGATRDLTGVDSPGSRLIDILDSGDALETATGTYISPDRFSSMTGWTDKGRRGQALQMKMGGALIDGMATNMKKADLKPWTEKEVEIIRQDQPDRGTQPYGWTDWSASKMRPEYDRKFDEAITAGTHTDETKTQFMNELDVALVRRALRLDTKYPTDELISSGVSPAIVRLVQLEIQKKIANNDAATINAYGRK